MLVAREKEMISYHSFILQLFYPFHSNLIDLWFLCSRKKKNVLPWDTVNMLSTSKITIL